MRKLSELKRAVEAARDADGKYARLSIELNAIRYLDGHTGFQIIYSVYTETDNPHNGDYRTLPEALEALERIVHPIQTEDILLDAEDVRAEMTFDEPNGGDDD